MTLSLGKDVRTLQNKAKIAFEKAVTSIPPKTLATVAVVGAVIAVAATSGCIDDPSAVIGDGGAGAAGADGAGAVVAPTVDPIWAACQESGPNAAKSVMVEGVEIEINQKLSAIESLRQVHADRYGR